MNEKNESIKGDVQRANVIMHSILADTYNIEQPHFRPENKALFSSKLSELANSSGKERLIDFGCGTGFVIDLAVPIFNSVIGVDITSKMVSKVDIKKGNVVALIASTESVPLESHSANVISANSFLHHLFDLKPTLSEAYRLLTPGGVFYSEEDPNILFWDAMKDLESSINKERKYLSDVVQREISAVIDTHVQIESNKGIDAHIVELAEYQKMIKGGMRKDEIKKIFNEVGFSKINIDYYWFLGQAKLMKKSNQIAQEIENYLKLIFPLSAHLFKYIRIEAWK